MLGVCLGGFFCASARAQKAATKPDAKTKASQTADASAEPDKILYNRALDELKHDRYTEERLLLQTLINTYPDSEYLAKAKLGIADSYYKEGGTANDTEAIQEYKDFITFFPFLDEAAYAQMQVAMAHYRMMEKPDRDKSEAEAAEDEFQTFLLKYPRSPLVPKAEQRLRDVQEILADGEYRVAEFYYLKQDYQASAARLFELSERYPLYSQSDEVLWMLGDVYTRAKQVSKNEDAKNHWADLAAECYDRIVTDYPLSKRAVDAKARLSEMGMRVPSPDPNAVARMKKEQLFEKKQHRQFIALRLPMELLKSSPSVSAAAHSGQPNLNPPDDAVSATDVLKPGAAGPSFEIASRPPASGNANADSGTVDSPTVDAGADESSSAPGMNAGAQIIAAPTTSGSPDPSAAASPAADQPPATTGSAAASSSSDSADPSIPTITLAPAPSAGTSAPAAGHEAPPAAGAVTATTGSSSPSASQQPAANAKVASKVDTKAESSSKKKKGLHKLVPF